MENTQIYAENIYNQGQRRSVNGHQVTLSNFQETFEKMVSEKSGSGILSPSNKKQRLSTGSNFSQGGQNIVLGNLGLRKTFSDAPEQHQNNQQSPKNSVTNSPTCSLGMSLKASGLKENLIMLTPRKSTRHNTGGLTINETTDFRRKKETKDKKDENSSLFGNFNMNA